MRARALPVVPLLTKPNTNRDSVAVYDALHKAGLQYGPAFQLLTNIHVPDSGM